MSGAVLILSLAVDFFVAVAISGGVGFSDLEIGFPIVHKIVSEYSFSASCYIRSRSDRCRLLFVLLFRVCVL